MPAEGAGTGPDGVGAVLTGSWLVISLVTSPKRFTRLAERAVLGRLERGDLCLKVAFVFRQIVREIDQLPSNNIEQPSDDQKRESSRGEDRRDTIELPMFEPLDQRSEEKGKQNRQSEGNEEVFCEVESRDC